MFKFIKHKIEQNCRSFFISGKTLNMKQMLFLKKWAVAALFLSAFAACKNNDDAMEPAKAKVMVVHASPDAPGVDLYVDNSKVNSAALMYPSNTGYLNVNAGDHNIKVNPTGTTTSVIDANVNFASNKAYSVFAYDTVSKIKALMVQDDLTMPASGKAHIRFMHLSPNAPAVTVGIVDGSTFTPVFSNRSFETQETATANQAFTPVDAGTYTFGVQLAATNTTVLTIPGVTLQAGKIYTVFARGLAGSTTAPLGAEVIVHN